MAVTWPTDLVAYRCDFYLRNNTTIFESPLTRSAQRLRRLGARWICEASFHFDRQKSQRLDAILDQLQGAYLTTTIWDFTRTAPYNGDPGGTPRVLTAYAAGTTSISISGLPVSQTRLLAGDYIELQGYLYRITADIAANGSGVGTALLNRGLVETLSGSPTSYPVTLTRPRAEMRLLDDDQPRRSKHYDGLYEYSVSLTEVL